MAVYLLEPLIVLRTLILEEEQGQVKNFIINYSNMHNILYRSLVVYLVIYLHYFVVFNFLFLCTLYIFIRV